MPAWPIGVMQGRLVPKYLGRYQAHPKGYWVDEFDIAASCGLDLIEFILDFNDAEENPLLAPGGIDTISRVSARTGVGVRSICADYFMEAPLHAQDAAAVAASQAVLARLLKIAPALGVTDIVIPCVDQSSLKGTDAVDRFVVAIAPALRQAEAAGVNLALETDLPPARFVPLLDRIGSKRMTVNYDIGNSASLGFDPNEEWAAYGDRVTDVHIKDRIRGGGSVPLGTGDADVPGVLALMARHGFDGPVIMQAFRDDEGVAIFTRQLADVRTWMGAVS